MHRRLLPLLFVICSGLPRLWAEEPNFSIRREPDWVICESLHFAVWGSAHAEVVMTARLCESLHRQLQTIWFEKPPAVWSKKCVVVLHAKAETFAVAVAQTGSTAVGCTTLQVDRGVVKFRRIDLRCDRSNWQTSALPHELTHVVLADRLSGKPLPLWADEGLAVLAEPEPTRAARDQALFSAIRDRRTIAIPTLLRLDSPPALDQRQAFYGQSAVLASRLIERKSRAAFLAFLERTQQTGNESALRECYGIDGVQGLAQLWSEYANAAAPGQFVELTERAAISPGAAVADASALPGLATP